MLSKLYSHSNCFFSKNQTRKNQLISMNLLITTLNSRFSVKNMFYSIKNKIVLSCISNV